MNVTSRSRYALKIMMDFATAPAGELLKRQGIIKRQGVPAKYLDQIMAQLRRAKIIESVRGRDGGYFLTRPPMEISVWEVFKAVETSMAPVICVDTEQQCGYEAGCISHDPWQVIFDTVRAPLEKLTIGDLSRDHADEKKMCPVGGVRECPPRHLVRLHNQEVIN